MSIWIIIALVVLGVVAAIAEFLRTSRAQRYKGTPRGTLEEKLKTFPATSQAVIIKGRKDRSLVNWDLYLLIGVGVGGFILWIENTGNLQCTSLLGINAAYVLLFMVCYVLPISILAVSIFLSWRGIKTVKTGYFPPLDSVGHDDFIAKKGTASTIRGIILLALPFFAIYLVYLGNDAYTGLANGKSKNEIIAKLEAKCR